MKLTENSALEIKKVLESQKMPVDATFVRVGIKGKTCSGTTYSFGLDDECNPETDQLSEQHGLKVVYDKEFDALLKDIVVEYADTGHQKGFTFTNPLTVLGGGCCGGSGGCGSGCE